MIPWSKVCLNGGKFSLLAISHEIPMQFVLDNSNEAGAVAKRVALFCLLRLTGKPKFRGKSLAAINA
jgi:hypothetical protein